MDFPEFIKTMHFPYKTVWFSIKQKAKIASELSGFTSIGPSCSPLGRGTSLRKCSTRLTYGQAYEDIFFIDS